MVTKRAARPALVLTLALGSCYSEKENWKASLAEDETFWGRQLLRMGAAFSMTPPPTPVPTPADECTSICGDTNNHTAFANREELHAAIRDRGLNATLVKYGPTVNCWNVSQVTNMFELFYEGNRDFDEDIFCWDVSNVTNMRAMFAFTIFDRQLDPWDVSSVTTMVGMFSVSQFNQELASWNVSSVTEMDNMFYGSKFNQELATWDVSSVTDIDYIFDRAAAFNQNLCSWGSKLGNTTSVTEMFLNTSCANQSDPDLSLPLPTPFCFNC